MFYEYTTDQLVELRGFCRDVLEHVSSGKLLYSLEAKDVVLLMGYIDEELAVRQRQKAA